MLSFTLFGARICFTFSFFALAALLMSGQTRRAYLAAIVFALLHETGHIAAMRAFGIRAEIIIFSAAGICIKSSRPAQSHVKSLITALAGPTVNLVLAALFFAADRPYPSAINAALCAVNLLPLSMLDGGSALTAALCMTLPADRALKIADAAEKAFSALICAALIFLFANGGGASRAAIFIFAVCTAAADSLLNGGSITM